MLTKPAKIIAAGACAAALAVCGLAGCSQSSPSSASSDGNASSAPVSANSNKPAESGTAEPSNASQNSSDVSGNANANSSSAAPGMSNPSGGADQAPPEESTVRGTVKNTTYAERAKEVGYPGHDFDDDGELLTLLVLDEPLTVTAYKGGSDALVEVNVIKLPNDEMFRQFKDKPIVIETDSWGEAPADVSGMLYDIVLDFDSDGVRLLEEGA